MLELHCHTRQPRHAILPLLRQALESAGAWVTDYREFSNKSVCVNFEFDAGQLPALRDSLLPFGIGIPSSAPYTGRGTLQVTLVDSSGHDEKSFIPAVPG